MTKILAMEPLSWIQKPSAKFSRHAGIPNQARLDRSTRTGPWSLVSPAGVSTDRNCAGNARHLAVPQNGPPPFIKLGRKIWYRLLDLEVWIEHNRRETRNELAKSRR